MCNPIESHSCFVVRYPQARKSPAKKMPAALTQVAFGFPRCKRPKIVEEIITPQNRFSPLASVCKW